MRQRSIRIKFLVILHCPTHFIFDMQRHFRLIIFVQQKKATVSVNNHFCFQLLTIDKDIFQASIDFFCHRNKAASALDLCFLNIILPATFSDKLMIHTDFPAIKIQITFCQATKLADTHPYSQQHDKFIIILCVGFILTDKAHPKFLLQYLRNNIFY